MKKVCLKKLVTTFLFISLVVMHPCDISAKESASDDFESTFELSQSKDFADDIQIITASDEKTTIKTDVEKKTSIKDSIIQNRTEQIRLEKLLLKAMIVMIQSYITDHIQDT